MIRKWMMASILAATVATAPAFAGPVYWHAAAPYRYYGPHYYVGPHYVGPVPHYCCYRGPAVGVAAGVAVGLAATVPRVYTPVYAPAYTPPPLVLTVPGVVYAAPPLRGYYFVP